MILEHTVFQCFVPCFDGYLSLEVMSEFVGRL